MSKQNQTEKDLQQQADVLKSKLAELNNALILLGKAQADLSEQLKKGSKGFEEIADSADSATKSLKQVNHQIKETSKSIDDSKKGMEQSKLLLKNLKDLYDDLSKSQSANSEQVKKLGDDISLITKNIEDQGKAVEKSKETFDYHKALIDQLKSATDKLKESNKDFAPVLEDLTKGFNMMKDGLAVVKTGFTGVGAAIKTTGFGLLVLVLQSVIEYFTKTTEGAKKLKGGIAAISLVIKTVKDTVSNIFSSIGENIVEAFSHPADTVKKVWAAVIDNLKSRFNGISVFFKGVFSGNLTEMNNGLIQMGTGITNGTAKLKNSFTALKNDISNAGTAIVKAYNDGATAGEKAAKKIANTNKKIGGQFAKLSTQKKQKDEGPIVTEKRTGVIDQEPRVDGATLPGLPSDLGEAEEKELQRKTLPEDAIIGARDRGDWQIEFELRQQQLNQEKTQAEKAALEKNQSVIKVDQDFKEKQKQLDKARLDAQFANQQNYLKSVDKLSGALTGIFGKNTIAAKAAFKAHQAAAVGQVVIDTQKSIMGIWSANASIPFIGIPKAIAETAIAVATGASSLAGIVKQKPGFAKGGHYMSDGRGALLSGYSRTDDTNAYLRSGEAVVVSEAMRNPWARNLISSINVAYGGRDFSTTNQGKGYAIGGIFTDGGNANRYYNQPANDVKDLANTLAYQMINNFPPIYVDVKDVNSQQNILAQTVNRVNL